MCAEKGVEPMKHYSGKFQVRLPPEAHARAVEMAATRGISLNRLLQDALEQVAG
jgi:predicted HicB family RNase H-like nuclease